MIAQPIAEVHNLLVKKFKLFPELLQLGETGTKDEECALEYVKACRKCQELMRLYAGMARVTTGEAEFR
jgi:hypothetical protein